MTTFALILLVAAQLGGWKSQWPDTDFDNKSVDLSEIRSGGPGKDGIPSIDNPKFVAVKQASDWVSGREPVILLTREGRARIYPIQILIWHEIANDQFGDLPVTVTFCPLCYSAIAFDRRVGGRVLEFGVTGLLRNSDLIMYDRQTESFWQQLTGEAIVGEMTGKQLEMVPATLVSFKRATARHPDAEVLSRDTGFPRNYGENPYAGYDDIDRTPLIPADGANSDKAKPMEHLAVVKAGEAPVAYPYSRLKRDKVVNDQVGDLPIAVFYEPETGTALRQRDLGRADRIGASAAYDRRLEDRVLIFEPFGGGRFKDRETGSTWNFFGEAVEGPLKGRRLKQLVSGDYFAFAWLSFRPATEVRRE